MLDELVRNETKGICGDGVNFKEVMNAILNTDENDFKETGFSEDYTGIEKKTNCTGYGDAWGHFIGKTTRKIDNISRRRWTIGDNKPLNR